MAGHCFGARGTGFVMFWDCEPGEFVRRIDVKVECGFSPIPLSLFSLIRPFFAQVFWSGTGSLVATGITIAEDSFYILRFNRDVYSAKVGEGAEITDEGVEEA